MKALEHILIGVLPVWNIRRGSKHKTAIADRIGFKADPEWRPRLKWVPTVFKGKHDRIWDVIVNDCPYWIDHQLCTNSACMLDCSHSSAIFTARAFGPMINDSIDYDFASVSFR